MKFFQLTLQGELYYAENGFPVLRVDKNTEVHASVFSDFAELQMCRKIIIPAMLKNEPSAPPEEVAAEDKLGKLILLLKVKWRVGKDKIVITGYVFQEPECISPDGCQLRKFKLTGGFLDKGMIPGV